MGLFGKIGKFLSDVKIEMGKVTWPTVEELKASTWVVIVFSLAFAAYIFLIDRGLTQLLRLIY